MTDRRGSYQRTPPPSPRPGTSPARGGAGDPGQPAPAIEKEVLRRIITDESAAQELVQEAEKLGQALARPLTTSQIRSLFTEVRQIQYDWQVKPDRAKHRLILLKPKMRYRVGRQTREARKPVETLVGVLEPALDLVQGDAANFRRFVEFFEAILAYHKAYGGN